MESGRMATPLDFGSFEQEDSGITSRYGGTGLGLSIVKRFSELMGGRVSVESRLGAGTTFTVELPFALAEQEKSRGVHYENLKALVVDDDQDTCEHVTGLLKQMNVKASWVDNGYQALSEIELAHGFDEDFDVCFIDWKMPNMDGLETTRRIRAMGQVRPDAGTIPILAMTANAFAEDAKKSMEARMNAHMSKPLDVKAVYAQLQLFLPNHDAGDPHVTTIET